MQAAAVVEAMTAVDSPQQVGQVALVAVVQVEEVTQPLAVLELSAQVQAVVALETHLEMLILPQAATAAVAL